LAALHPRPIITDLNRCNRAALSVGESAEIYRIVRTFEMPLSPLQDIFLKELAANFQATRLRIVRRLSALPATDTPAADAIIQNELQGLYHGILTIFDGGTSLADHGLLQIVDDQGAPFARNLHEICTRYWNSEETA
jgi:hypothetical protein